jgi:succinate-semialdehyde dehydrogenase/glutarate-semialdehyde dehydrogenase
MELGGSDPFIVFADAAVDEAVKVGVASRCLNGGQSCIAAKRFLVERKVYDRYVAAFVAAIEAKPFGDPRDRANEIGPMARQDLRDHLARQVERAVAAGAEVRCGGEVPDGDGFFYPPTVLTGLSPEAEAAQEEIFGPVATIYAFDDEDEAAAIANATPYGLGASLWTSDRARAERLIPRLDSGSVFVNGLVKSDPRLPFGGVKDSGFGRELAREGILEWVNVKTVWIK